VSSFESWFSRLLPFAYNVGYRFRPGDRSFAEDVAQESLTRAYAVWPRLHDHPNLEAWVTTTAFRVALELSRQGERAGRPNATAPVAAVPGDEHRVAEADELAKAMERLSSRQQEVLVWRALQTNWTGEGDLRPFRFHSQFAFDGEHGNTVGRGASRDAVAAGVVDGAPFTALPLIGAGLSHVTINGSTPPDTLTG